MMTISFSGKTDNTTMPKYQEASSQLTEEEQFNHSFEELRLVVENVISQNGIIEWPI